jgi:hypothetical protein
MITIAAIRPPDTLLLVVLLVDVVTVVDVDVAVVVEVVAAVVVGRARVVVVAGAVVVGVVVAAVVAVVVAGSVVALLWAATGAAESAAIAMPAARKPAQSEATGKGDGAPRFRLLFMLA